MVDAAVDIASIQCVLRVPLAERKCAPEYPRAHRMVCSWQCPGCEAVAEYIRYELEPETKEIPDWPGCEVEVRVTEFSGLQPYCDRAQLEKICEAAMASFKEKFARGKNLDNN